MTAASPDLLPSITAQASTFLWAATGSCSLSSLYRINPATAAGTLVAPILAGAAAVSMTGLAVHPTTLLENGPVHALAHPGAVGEPVLRDLSQRRQHRPVVLITAETGSDNVAAGVTTYLRKPFTPAHVRSRVRAWLLRTTASAAGSA